MKRGWRWLGGSIRVECGSMDDWRRLERFHYLGAAPPVIAGIWRVVFVPQDGEARTVAVGVMAHAVPSCSLRERALDVANDRYAAGKMRWMKRNLRCIARIVVHPQFRGIGLASLLVRVMLEECG